jgi:hypothetical protein
MIQKQVNLYTYDELSDDAKKKALAKWSEDNHDIVQIYFDEIFDSYKSFIECTSFTLANYKIDLYNQYIELSHDYKDEIFELQGKRAMAWLENDVLSQFRVTHRERFNNIKLYSKYGEGYKTGQVKTCPLTGYCYDDIFIDEFKMAILGGSTVETAFYAVEITLSKLLIETNDWTNSEEYFREDCESNEVYFLENGQISSI